MKFLKRFLLIMVLLFGIFSFTSYHLRPLFLVKFLSRYTFLQPFCPNSVFSFRVAQETRSQLVLDIAYFYNGSCGPNPYLGVITLKQGQSTGYWSYNSSRLKKGLHHTQITIGINSKAPRRYKSDELEFKMSSPDCGVFFQGFTLPYQKKWVRSIS